MSKNNNPVNISKMIRIEDLASSKDIVCIGTVFRPDADCGEINTIIFTKLH